MAEFSENLWAPWRMEYIHSLTNDEDPGCFLCQNWASPEDDRTHLMLWRGQAAMAVLNRFPYTSGHLLIAPCEHVAGLDDLGDEQMLELLAMTRDAQAVLQAAIQPQGFNVGMNFGRCAGAGLPGHLHIHVVPRWEGDTNFMPVLGQVRVIPQALDAMYDLLTRHSADMNLPKPVTSTP